LKSRFFAAVFLLALSVGVSASESYIGYAVSLGPARLVTARLTYRRAQALQGGFIYAIAQGQAEDDRAIAASRGLLLTGGGIFSRAAVSARRHGTAAVVVASALWRSGALVVQQPAFGAAKAMGPFSFAPLSSLAPKTIQEGEIISIDPVRGLLSMPSSERADSELALSEALPAFAGLRDCPALLHWWKDRKDSADASWLGPRLVSELLRSASFGVVSAEDAVAAVQSIASEAPPALRSAIESEEKRALAELVSVMEDRLSEIESALKRVSTKAAALRLGAEGEALAQRLSVLNRLSGKKSVSHFLVRKSSEVRETPDWKQAAKSAGAQVPPSAVLSPDFYRDFISAGGLSPLLADLVSNASLGLKRKASRAQDLFDAAKFDSTSVTARAVLSALPSGERLAVIGPGGRRIVARGQILGAVKQAWGDWWSARDLGRREREGRVNEPPSVTIESIPNLSISGTLDTRDPVREGLDRMILRFGDEEMEIARSDGKELMPTLSAASVSLTDFQRRLLVRAGRAVEDELGAGVELEFGFSGDVLYILSARRVP
jgi:hypothetical protein